jgi:hypothetical protein
MCSNYSFSQNSASSRTDRQTNDSTVDCEGADSNRYGGGHGAAADSFISTKLLMDNIFSTDLLKVSTERQQNHSTFKAGARRCTQ